MITKMLRFILNKRITSYNKNKNYRYKKTRYFSNLMNRDVETYERVIEISFSDFMKYFIFITFLSLLIIFTTTKKIVSSPLTIESIEKSVNRVNKIKIEEIEYDVLADYQRYLLTDDKESFPNKYSYIPIEDDVLSILSYYKITNYINQHDILNYDFLTYIKDSINKYSFDRWGVIDLEFMIALMDKESDFIPTAISHRGAIGLAQIMPLTAKSLNEIYKHKLQYTLDPNNKYDNVILSILYLSELINKYDGVLYKALRFYNGGTRWSNIPSTDRYAMSVINKKKRLYKHRDDYIQNKENKHFQYKSIEDIKEVYVSIFRNDNLININYYK